MTSAHSKSVKAAWWLMAILLVFSPFHAFLITWLKQAVSAEGGAAFVNIAAGWREIFASAIILIVLAEIWHKKKFVKLDILDWAIIAYCAIAIVWLIFQRGDFSQWALGFRFDVFPILFFAFVRRIEWPKKNILIATALISASVAVIFGILQSIVLPRDFLTHFGYSTYQGAYTPDNAIAGCQYLEHTSDFCRAISTFGGPTRYGTYLILILGLLLPFLAAASRWRKYAAAVFALVIFNIALTYSRSIWISAAAMLLIFAIWIIKEKIGEKKLTKKILAGGLIFFAFLAAGLGVFTWRAIHNETIPGLQTIFVRATSTGEHLELLLTGAKTVYEHPLGIGLGMAGPASVRFQKLLTENWFLQIAVEMGLIGLMFFSAILFLISKKLLKRKNWACRGLFLALLGISITGLFTHSFEETTAVLMLFGLSGAFLER